jgi:hypothetical protein
MVGQYIIPTANVKTDDTRKHSCWKVRAPAGELVCLTVYRRGAREVVRRLGLAAA